MEAFLEFFEALFWKLFWVLFSIFFGHYFEAFRGIILEVLKHYLLNIFFDYFGAFLNNAFESVFLKCTVCLVLAKPSGLV